VTIMPRCHRLIDVSGISISSFSLAAVVLCCWGADPARANLTGVEVVRAEVEIRA